jgi:RNA polymerase sigma-70 factor (ECF subfamily)
MSDVETKSRLTAWFRQWRTPLRKFLSAKGAVQPADLDDVAQEVFLRLIRYDKADIVEHPQAYLYKMASNVAAEWAIRTRNRRPHRSQWLEPLASDSAPDEELTRAETHARLMLALSSLTARQREILKLRFVNNLTEAQAAERLAISKRVVKRQMIKSYAKLRDVMHDDLIEKVPHGRE